MSKGTLNKVILIGRLGADPELFNTPNSKGAKLKLATTESYKDKDGNWVDSTEWHTVIIYGRTAEVASEYLAKGSKVYVEGKLKTRKWQDKQGNDRYTTEISGQQLMLMDGKKELSDKPAPATDNLAARVIEAGDLSDIPDDFPF